MPGPFYASQNGGEECITCCATFTECDCDIQSCVNDYIEYIGNVIHSENLGISSAEFMKAALLLSGFASMGTYWRPEVDGVVVNTFGRLLVRSDIEHHGTPGTEWRKWFNFILRVLDYQNFQSNPLPALRDKWCLEGRCDCNMAQRWCDELECLFDGMRTYLEIGNTGNAPYTTKEWERKLCGVCYPEGCVTPAAV